MTPTELLAARQRLRMSQTELGDYLGVRQGTVSHYERGAIRVPGIVAKRVASLLEARIVSRRYKQTHTLRRLSDAEIRDALVRAKWHIQTAAKDLRVQSGALYMHVYKYLGDEWRARPARQTAAPRRKQTTLHPWRTKPAGKVAA